MLLALLENMYPGAYTDKIYRHRHDTQAPLHYGALGSLRKLSSYEQIVSG